MKIDIFWPWELPKRLSGITVIIDVNATTTNIPLILSQRIKKLYIVNEKNIFLLKSRYKNAILIGQSKILPKKFFQVSNEPLDIKNTNLTDKVVLYMSINGSKVIEKVFQFGAEKVISASFVNIEKVTSWLKKQTTHVITLIPAGETVFSDRKSEEDLYCAKSIESNLHSNKTNIDYYVNKAKRFIRLRYSSYLKDLENNLKIELSINKYPSVPLCHLNKNKDDAIIIRNTQ